MRPIGDYPTEMAKDCPHSLFYADIRASQSIECIFQLTLGRTLEQELTF